MDSFTRAYIECALWSSVDYETDEPLDENHDIYDLAPETLNAMIADCADFQQAASALLDELTDPRTGENLTAIAADPDDQHGHDFWLTRNGHGAGFWDRGYGPTGDKLTDLAKAWGSVDLCIGDDGKIYA